MSHSDITVTPKARKMPNVSYCCKKCGKNDFGIKLYDDHWIDCEGCKDYKICTNCAYKISPTIGPQAPSCTYFVEKANLIEFLDKDDKKNVNDRTLWKILCPQCTTFMNKRRVNDGNVDDNIEVDRDGKTDLIQSLDAKIIELANIVGNIDSQLKEIKGSFFTISSKKSYAEVAQRLEIENIAEVVQSSVKNAITADESEKDIIISHLPEKSLINEDIAQIREYCEAIGCKSDCIKEVVRLGRITEGYNRLTKVSFSTKFDARTFYASYQRSIQNNENLRKYRVRPSQTNEINKVRKANSNLVFNWNKESINKGISYSLRLDGSIWCFKKQSNEKWVRDKTWKFADHSL